MYIDNIRLIDDSFFEIFFRDDPKYIEVVIHEIFKHIGRPLASIEKVETQSRLQSLGHRELCLDLLATDSNQNKINIEIQRATTDILTKRARYHSALLDSNTLNKNHDFCELRENYIIFSLLRKIFANLVNQYIKSSEFSLRTKLCSMMELTFFLLTDSTNPTIL